MSDRAVYIGGCGGSLSTANSVASALSRHYYRDVDPFTFSFAVDNHEVVRNAVDGVDVITHGAGMLAVLHTFPAEIRAFAAPLPTPLHTLASRKITKTARLFTPGISIQSLPDIIDVTKLHLGWATELMTHPIANLSQLKAIARFDAVKEATRAVDRGINTTLAFMTNDAYYQPNYEQIGRMAEAAINFTWLPGEHDALPLQPQAFVDLYYSSTR